MRKKKLFIGIIIAVVIVVVAGLLIFAISNRSNNAGKLTILDNSGNQMAVLSDLSSLKGEYTDDSYKAYIQVVVSDAVKEISEKNSCSESKAQNILMNNCVINTYFDKNVFDACKSTYENLENANMPFAVAFTNLKGGLICVYSSDNDTNFATAKTQPYSSFKPLSVYAPAIEYNVVTWSTMFEDSPIKKVKSEDGNLVDWPTNQGKDYLYENVSVADGIKLSLNTTAVRCLQELGTDRSMSFLSENFNIDIEHEKEISASAGSDEILSNLGLGYLSAGVSPIEMAGYYQIFANGGMYCEPSTIEKITNAKSDVIYEFEKTSKRVISEDTAFIMNKLLQNTLSIGGTAEKAAYKDVAIGGKTGTGDNNTDNWFVGFTPEYSFSIWHGNSSDDKNNCAEIFSLIASKISFDNTRLFPVCDSVTEMAYCGESGELLTYSCRKMEVGYYKDSFVPNSCSEHSDSDR